MQQGQLLSKQAYAKPPITPTGLALTLVIIILILAVFSTIVIALRIHARAWMGDLQELGVGKTHSLLWDM
jgi:hypothetical protein